MLGCAFKITQLSHNRTQLQSQQSDRAGGHERIEDEASIHICSCTVAALAPLHSEAQFSLKARRIAAPSGCIALPLGNPLPAPSPLPFPILSFPSCSPSPTSPTPTSAPPPPPVAAQFPFPPDFLAPYSPLRFPVTVASSPPPLCCSCSFKCGRPLCT